MTRAPGELLREALERLLGVYCVENVFGDDMCPDCHENPEHVHGPGHGEGCPVPIIQAALGALGALENGPLEPTQALKDLGGVRVMVPMLLDTTTGERFVAPDVAEVVHNVRQALRAREDRQVMVPREIVENLLAGWDEGLWGPETQDAGAPDTVVGLVDGLRAALAQAQAGAGEGEGEGA